MWSQNEKAAIKLAAEDQRDDDQGIAKHRRVFAEEDPFKRTQKYPRKVIDLTCRLEAPADIRSRRHLQSSQSCWCSSSSKRVLVKTIANELCSEP